MSQQLSRRRLEMQANRIEAALAARNVSANIWRFTVGPATINYELSLRGGATGKRVEALVDDIALNLGAGSVDCAQQDGAVVIQVPLCEVDR